MQRITPIHFLVLIAAALALVSAKSLKDMTTEEIEAELARRRKVDVGGGSGRNILSAETGGRGGGGGGDRGAPPASGGTLGEKGIEMAYNDLKALINEKKECVVVEVYATWCGHCKQLAPTWDQLTEKFAGVEGVKVVKIESSDPNVKSGMGVKGFPTIQSYNPKDSSPTTYAGQRTLPDLISWINTECGSNVEIPKDWKPPPPPDQSPEEQKMMGMVTEMQKYMIMYDFENAKKAADIIVREENERWTRIVNKHLDMTRTADAGGLLGKNIFKTLGMDAKTLNSGLKYQAGDTFFDTSKTLIVTGAYALHSPRSRSGIADYYKWQKELDLPDVHFSLFTPEHGGSDLGREADKYKGLSIADFSGHNDWYQNFFGEAGMMACYIFKPDGELIWYGHWGILWVENRYDLKDKVENAVLIGLKKIKEDPDYDFSKGIPSGEEVNLGQEEEEEGCGEELCTEPPK